MFQSNKWSIQWLDKKRRKRCKSYHRGLHLQRAWHHISPTILWISKDDHIIEMYPARVWNSTVFQSLYSRWNIFEVDKLMSLIFVHQARAPINPETISICSTNARCFSWSLISAEQADYFFNISSWSPCHHQTWHNYNIRDVYHG